MWNDIRLGIRLLVKDRWFAAAAVLVLALGIAATNTAFTIVNGVLLRSMPFDDPGRIVQVGDASYAELQDWRTRTRTLAGVAGMWEQPMNVSDDTNAAERFRGAYVSFDAFRLVGRQPVLGRDFAADDERVGAAPVVLLSHTLWRTRYRSDPDIVGRPMRINGASAVVIGVMPQGFEFPLNAKLWQPLTLVQEDLRNNRSARTLRGVGRLRAGVTEDQAQTELATITAALAREYPDHKRELPPNVEPFRSGIGGPIVAVMAALMGAVTFVLLIACANVANLLLARGSARSREISVRMSMGASRWRIVRQLLVENLLLALLAGGVALALSAASVRLFWSVVTQVGDPPPFWMTFPIDRQVFAFLVAVSLGTLIVFGLLPAVHTTRTSIVDLLNDTSSRSVGTRRGRHWAGGLVVAQLALALVLLSGAGLMMRSLLTQVTMSAGVDTTGLLRMALDLPAGSYGSPERRRVFYRQLDERLAALPGSRASLASSIPMAGTLEGPVQFEDRPVQPEARQPVASLMTVGPRYFETVGARLVQGRAFGADDGRAGPGAVLVNERFVEMFFDGASPLGRRIRPGANAEWMTVIGVATNVRQRITDTGAFDPVVYLPVAVNPPARINVLLRASNFAAVAPVVRAEVRALDVDLPLYDLRTVDEQLAISRWPARVFGSIFVIFAAIALILAGVGLYAVTAYSVVQRRQEIGVRMALGARAAEVGWLVTRRASTQLAVGLILGGAGAAAVSRVIPAVLAGSRGADPLTLVAVSALLLAVGVAAALIPARRAMRLDPVAAMRTE
jgi:predicted permease